MIKVSIPHYHYRNNRLGEYLRECVGKSPETWSWYSTHTRMITEYFICFTHEEDAVVFKLKF